VIEILKARRYVTGSIEATAHLDNSRVLEDGTPDPAWVLSHSWFINPDEWAARTPAQRQEWITSMQQEFAEMCREARVTVDDREAGGAVLPIEGSEFPP
jgi:hypothetical protein